MSSWSNAIKAYYVEHPEHDKSVLPKKGTPLYDEVKKMHASMKVKPVEKVEKEVVPDVILNMQSNTSERKGELVMKYVMNKATGEMQGVGSIKYSAVKKKKEPVEKKERIKKPKKVKTPEDLLEAIKELHDANSLISQAKPKSEKEQILLSQLQHDTHKKELLLKKEYQRLVAVKA